MSSVTVDTLTTLMGNCAISKMYENGSFWIAKRTVPMYINTKGGLSKNKEWVIIEGVPSKIIDYKDNIVTMNAFTSSSSRTFSLKDDVMPDYFTKADMVDDTIIAPKYPFPIKSNEFDIRDDVISLERLIKNTIKNPDCNPKVKSILNDKLFQLIQSQGSKYIKITDYDDYMSGKIVLTNHKRFGVEIFNRNYRWCPPIDISYDDFCKSPSYPAPLGIRPKDFCLPSELLDSIIEMVTQIYNMKNIDKASFDIIKEKYTLEEREVHTCKYCGNCLDANEYDSIYKSEENYMEICHRDPQDRFLVRNMYWGHGNCNRKQGGYCEETCMLDGLKLLLLNGKMTQEEYEMFKSRI